MANEIIKTQLHPQKPADETDIIYPETSADQIIGLPKTNETTKQTVVANKDGYSLMPYNAPTQVRVGETQTLPEGYQASVQNVGTPEAPVLNFQIPQGKTGLQGQRGLQGVEGKTFYILSRDIRNGVGDVTLSVPVSEFQPTLEAVKGEVVRGISQPSGALFSALPDYDNGAFAGTFTVTTLGYAGVAHGGTIDDVLDINANVHIGRGNPEAILYVREIRRDNTPEETGGNNLDIVFQSNVLFDNRVIFNQIITRNIEATGRIITDDNHVKVRSIVNKLSVGSIGKSNQYREGEGVLLESSIDAGNHRIFNCKINTNNIDFNIVGLTSGQTFTTTNLYDNSIRTFNADGSFISPFPCILQSASSFVINSNRFGVYVIDDGGFSIVDPNVGHTVSAGKPCLIFLGNYGKPSTDPNDAITFNFTIR